MLEIQPWHEAKEGCGDGGGLDVGLGDRGGELF